MPKIVKVYGTKMLNIAIEANTRRVIYRYQVNADFGFEFDLISHVGNSYVRSFEKLISDNNLKIELYDNPNDIYQHGFYERLVN